MNQMKTLKTKEGKKMRKMLITLFLVSLSVVLFHGAAMQSQAYVTSVTQCITVRTAVLWRRLLAELH